ncbi:MAG: hypothetical protein RIQ71_857 [Verrucomicrobiota bacterium]|jgi:hypothetical protein
MRLREALLACFLCAASAAQAAESCDVLVYGATAGGVMSAIAAAKHGANVILLEPGNHVGGMLSGGLGRTDMDRQENVIGGLAMEFFRRVGQHYGEQVAWTFEPSVAEKVLKEMLAEQKIRVEFGTSLQSVAKENGVLTRLITTDGREYRAPVFIDATYEGDLMKAAGVSYAVGRESRSLYGESLAGRRDILRSNHQVNFPISPWKEGKLLPHITAEEDLAPTGTGDGKLQAYCFRLCLTDVPENMMPVTPPDNYNPADYELLRRCFEVGGEKVDGILGIKRMPNGKSDVNAGAPISLNLLGANQDYPDGSPERRKEIWKQHLDWARGLVYFVQNDPSVPEGVRKKYKPWGLCKDEFTDTGGWPHQMYIRESRRMKGEYILTQHDLMENRRKEDCIGMAGYNIDIREVQWVSLRTFFFPKAEDQVYMEGYVSQPVEPWDIPYRALLPKAEECRNLLVPVCVSASTIANASFRMEPQYMIAGQAAGTAAAMAGQVDGDVQLVDVTALQKLLRKDGQILGLPAASAGVLDKVNEATRL